MAKTQNKLVIQLGEEIHQRFVRRPWLKLFTKSVLVSEKSMGYKVLINTCDGQTPTEVIVDGIIYAR